MASDNVIAFQPKADTLSGQARCARCKHEWVAVAPVGTEVLECPQCETMHGLFVNMVASNVGDLTYTCNCGCEALTAYKREGRFYFRCVTCGIDHTNGLFGEPSS